MPLVENCAWNVGFRPHLPGYPYACIPSQVACTKWDPRSYQRGGAYDIVDHIWFDWPARYFNSTGFRAVAAHELGHVFGLDERYVDDGSAPLYTCTSEVSIMDGVGSTGHCDGIVSPQAIDTARVNDWYTIRPADQQSLLLWPNRLLVWSFRDRNYTEQGYQKRVQRWQDVFAGWVTYVETAKIDGIAPCDDHQPCGKSDSYTVPGGYYYRICITPHNGVFGPRPETCTNYVWVG